MEIDIPEVKAAVEAAFTAYEEALVVNDIAALDAFFLDAPTTIRYGVAENLYGADEIAAYRAGINHGLLRRLERTVVTSYGHDFAVASTLFVRVDEPDRLGRQMQTWVRTEDGWKVAAAHVSTMPLPGTWPQTNPAEGRRV